MTSASTPCVAGNLCICTLVLQATISTGVKYVTQTLKSSAIPPKPLLYPSYRFLGILQLWSVMFIVLRVPDTYCQSLKINQTRHVNQHTLRNFAPAIVPTFSSASSPRGLAELQSLQQVHPPFSLLPGNSRVQIGPS
ncbi:hypothetical protein V8C43DRAFT_259778 [Trichoderma afarasin]